MSEIRASNFVGREFVEELASNTLPYPASGRMGETAVLHTLALI
jgi:hypothetical protein